MKKSSNDINTIFILNAYEWQNFIQFNPSPESFGIKVNLMNDNSRKIIINTSESYKVMRFEAALSAALLKIEK